jgi:hypothetical protein
MATAAEERIFEHAPTGVPVDLRDLDEDERVVPAQTIRQLCVGPGAEAVDPRGIRITGARVVETLDLTFCKVPHPITFKETSFDAMPLFAWCTIPTLAFLDCKLPGFTAGEAHVDFLLSLSDSEIDGPVVLIDGRIDGSLSLEGTQVTVDPAGVAVAADRLELGGMMVLTGAKTVGEVRAVDARVGGDVICTGARMESDDDALTLDGAVITGNVELADGFDARGTVRLVGATVHGSVVLRRATIKSDDALLLMRTSIGTWLALERSSLAGAVRLQRAEAAGLMDDLGSGRRLGSWSDAAPLVLGGFDYRLFAGEASWDPDLRFAWLRSTDRYDAAAWTRLAAVYRSAGRENDARNAAIAGENDRLRRGDLNLPRTIGRWLLKLSIGHGYRPWLAGIWAAGVVAVFTSLVAIHSENFRPEKTGVEGDPQALVYAADVFLPIVDLNEGANWIATGHVRWAEWTTIMLGWLLTTVFVAGFTRVVRS